MFLWDNLVSRFDVRKLFYILDKESFEPFEITKDESLKLMSNQIVKTPRKKKNYSKENNCPRKIKVHRRAPIHYQQRQTILSHRPRQFYHFK